MCLVTLHHFDMTELERTDLSWKVRAEVELSKFKRSFPTSVGSFQLRWTLANFSETFQL